MAIIRKRKTEEEKELENPSTCQTFTDMYYRYIEQGARNREKRPILRRKRSHQNSRSNVRLSKTTQNQKKSRAAI